MRLYQSNRLERLFSRLVEICQSEPLTDPFAKEIIVVQHPGMSHWLARQWAFKTGIAALLDFPLPARALGALHRRLNPQVAQDAVWQREVLHWRILALLPEYAQNAEQGGLFAPLAPYLQKGADEAARFRLAGRIAAVFDQYQTYRPDLLAEWENTTAEKDWQAVLWRRLCADQPPHRARLDADLARLLSQPPGSLRDLPTRLHFFGIGSLAPIYLHILTLLGQHLEVHCYHLSACRRYWHNLAEARQQGLLFTPQISNPLLVQLGQTERDLVRQFLAKGLDEPQDLYETPEGESLLERLQNLLLDGQDAPPTPAERIPVSPEDRSLELHDCFSPLREVQALHDFLLDSFQRDPELRPGDILVTAPDMSLYAASVQAVFGETLPQHSIPFALPGQNRGNQSLTRVFLELLSSLNSRCTSTELLSLLEEPALQRRFGLETAHLPVACALVQQAGICWGLDEAHRQALDPESAAGPEHSFRQGLDRLLLGWAMGEVDGLHQGLAPCPLAGDEAELVLTALLQFYDQLALWRREWQQARPARDWPPLLLQLLSDFLDPETGAESLSGLRGAIQRLDEELESAAFAAPLSSQTVQNWLTKRLNQQDQGRAFLSGRVTFSNFTPLCTLPFKIICLLGLNDDAFPRLPQAAGFNWIARQPRLGDRNRRDDDRCLFLETLLSARQRLFLSWNGRSLQDGTARPPSPVVSELCDALDQNFQRTDQPNSPVSQWLTVVHPLQPFSPKNYTGEIGEPSFDPGWLPQTEAGSQPAFLDGPLDTAETAKTLADSTLDLAQLVRFWTHPCRYFVRHILGMTLMRDEDLPAESEPFSLDNLELWGLRNDIIRRLLAGQSQDHIARILIAQGRLPLRNFAPLTLNPMLTEAADLAALVQPLLVHPRSPQAVQLEVAGLKLSGQVDSLYAAERVLWSAGAPNTRTLISLWLSHLVLAAQGVPVSSYLVFRDRTIGPQEWFWPVLEQEEAHSLLLPWVQGFLSGQEEALPFFPKSSLAWAEAMRSKRQSPDEVLRYSALNAARKKWQEGWNSQEGRTVPGEGSDPAHALLFPQEDPFTDEFCRLAGLLLPLLDMREEESHAAA